ncbi:CaiB/BaiF CoA-transferase family protein [Herbaspirillum sp. YR522]|uniref:CaiB/BaiF CoA transferase family protein n=1 Tax=Herbaspirillum sp. YR522 TaxID=1144342 RepID=UPI00026FCD9B|nr:CaiB/BaiF CoA-transferase family protein [Herbaspirillum sp. YR522]EJM99698.1 putative acyl-CoA transferase/carnitine dehydratase [Herbaspirillum sp. YR522]
MTAARAPNRGPLSGLLVLDMAQFLSGPSAALRLADLGARVIKVERSGTGDICRTLYLTDTDVDGDSTLFHAINRNKESLALDLKTEHGLAALKKLVTRADVLVHNFRPGVIDRLGLDYDTVKGLNARLVYAGISGYGESGDWAQLPGQDLLAQSLSGVTWLNGHDGDGPVPLGLSIADMLAGHILTEGILAALVRRGITGQGAQVQTSLLEALIDLQFELLTTYMNDGQRIPQRAQFRNANAYLAAPYGLYPTADGYLALAMMPLQKLAGILQLPQLDAYSAEDAFSKRDEIKRLIASQLVRQSTQHWLARLQPQDVWCAEVLDWPRLLESDAFGRLGMTQWVQRGDGARLRTTRSPVRIDGIRPENGRAAPQVGEHTDALVAEFDLDARR